MNAGMMIGALVLVVEDDPDISFLITEILHHLGLEVVCHADGESAMRWFKDHHRCLDLVILDRRLPGIGGGALFRAMRCIAPAVPVILSSGDLQGDEAVRLQTEGVDAILPKPVNVRRFSATVCSVLGRGRGRSRGRGPRVTCGA